MRLFDVKILLEGSEIKSIESYPHKEEEGKCFKSNVMDDLKTHGIYSKGYDVTSRYSSYIMDVDFLNGTSLFKTVRDSCLQYNREKLINELI